MADRTIGMLATTMHGPVQGDCVGLELADSGKSRTGDWNGGTVRDKMRVRETQARIVSYFM